MSFVAISAGLAIAGGIVNMYVSSPPISVYASDITRAMLERWINNAKAFRAKIPAFYPYVNEIVETVQVTDRDRLQLIRWLDRYNDKIVDEWGEESRLHVPSYIAMRQYPIIWKFVLEHQLHINENYLYDANNAQAYNIRPPELFELASLTNNYNDYVQMVVSRIESNTPDPVYTTPDSGSGDTHHNDTINGSYNGDTKNNEFKNGFLVNLLFFIFGVVIYNLIFKK